jgi:subtilase family serine protease
LRSFVVVFLYYKICVFFAQTALQQTGLKGVTVVAASGDGGSHFSFQPFSELSSIGRALNTISCALNLPTYPASSPYVLGVGGTSWNAPGSPASPVGWSGSGGGFSRAYASPAYQQAAVQGYLNRTSNLPPPSSFNASNRAYPDLAAVADNVPICIQVFFVSGWYFYGIH